MKMEDSKPWPRLRRGIADLFASGKGCARLTGISALVGGIFAAGAGLPMAATAGASTAALSWTPRREEDSRDASKEQLVLTRASEDASFDVAAHRSHRSHSSHYSGNSGHQSHSSHYSSYQTTPSTPPRTAVPSTTTTTTRPPARYTPTRAPSTTVSVESSLPQSGMVRGSVDERVLLLQDGKKVRLKGITMGPQGWDGAKAAVLARTANRNVIIRYDNSLQTIEPYDGYIFIYDDVAKSNVCVNVELVEKGLALHDRTQTCSQGATKALAQAEEKARKAAVGVWRDTSFVEDGVEAGGE